MIPNYEDIQTRSDSNGNRIPDFEKSVPLPSCGTCDDCDDCVTSWWTPRNASLIFGFALDGCDYLLSEDGDMTASNLIPFAARRHLSMAVVQKFAVVLRNIAYRTAAGLIPRPRCTAEELALSYILNSIDFWSADLTTDNTDDKGLMLHLCPEYQNELPRTGGDYDIETLRDAMFDDLDFLDLFKEEWEQGIDPNAWFISFSGDDMGYDSQAIRCGVPGWFQSDF